MLFDHVEERLRVGRLGHDIESGEPQHRYHADSQRH